MYLMQDILRLASVVHFRSVLNTVWGWRPSLELACSSSDVLNASSRHHANLDDVGHLRVGEHIDDSGLGLLLHSVAGRLFPASLFFYPVIPSARLNH